MKIVHDLSVETIEQDELILMLGGDLGKAENAKKIIKDNCEVLEEGKKLASPKAIFDIFEVAKIVDNRIYLNSEEYFESELFVKFLTGVQYVALYIPIISP